MHGANDQSDFPRPISRLTLAAAFLTVILAAVPARADDNPTAAVMRQSGEQLTQDVVRQQRRYQRATRAERAQAEAELRSAAMARHDLLAELIKDHPEEVLRLALPDSVAAGMPADLRG